MFDTLICKYFDSTHLCRVRQPWTDSVKISSCYLSFNSERSLTIYQDTWSRLSCNALGDDRDVRSSKTKPLTSLRDVNWKLDGSDLEIRWRFCH